MLSQRALNLSCVYWLGSPHPKLTTACASLCRELNNTSSYDEAFDVMELLDACVVMVITCMSEERAQQYRSHRLSVLWGCLSKINSFPSQGPTAQPTGSIWRHDLIVMLLWTPCKSQQWFKSCAKSRAMNSPDWRQDLSFPEWHSARLFLSCAQPPPSAYKCQTLSETRQVRPRHIDWTQAAGLCKHSPIQSSFGLLLSRDSVPWWHTPLQWLYCSFQLSSGSVCGLLAGTQC